MRLATFGIVIVGMAAYSGAIAVAVAQTTGSVLPHALAQVTEVLTQVSASLSR